MINITISIIITIINYNYFYYYITITITITIIIIIIIIIIMFNYSDSTHFGRSVSIWYPREKNVNCVPTFEKAPQSYLFQFSCSLGEGHHFWVKSNLAQAKRSRPSENSRNLQCSLVMKNKQSSYCLCMD